MRNACKEAQRNKNNNNHNHTTHFPSIEASSNGFVNDRTSKRPKEYLCGAQSAYKRDENTKQAKRTLETGRRQPFVCSQTIQSIRNREAKETDTRCNGKGNVIQINRLYSFAIVFFWPLGNGLSMHWSERTNMIRLIFKSTAQSSTSNCSSLIHTKYIFLSHNEQAECYFASAEWYIETKIMMIFPNFAQIKVTHWKLDTNSNYCWSICLGLDFHLVLFANALRMCEINNVLWFSFIDSFVSYGFCGNNRYLFMYSQFRLNKANAIHLIHIGDRTFIVCGSNFSFKT